MASPDLRLGIDVGGTNTDAVVLSGGGEVLAKAKVATTADVTGGITAAIGSVVAELGDDSARIGHVMLGTTQVTNAVVARRSLRRVAVLRIGGPATHAVRPLASWPPDLRNAVAAGTTIVQGGIELHGGDIATFDAEATARFFDSLAGQVDAAAITSVFAAVSDRHEAAAERIAREVLGDVHVSLSHEIGTIGLIERENATVLNAALIGLAEEVGEALRAALAEHGLEPELFLAQNDGTLMSLEHALRFPVLTIGCGPANAIRGAAHLSGAEDALVADIGGTTAEVGALVGGYPVESGDVVGLGGVRTNFRMPDVVAVPLGGGTVIGGTGRSARVGRDSVGHRLRSAALVFGGSTPTLTDAAVAAGRAEVGDPRLVDRRRGGLAAALAHADALLADAVDRAKIARGEPSLIVVGGAGFLVSDDLPGVSDVVRPRHAEVANAIGAAIGLVSGQVERIAHFGISGRAPAISEAREAAKAQAVRAGADPDRIAVVEIEEAPLAYLTDPAVRLRVKAVGPLGNSPRRERASI